VKPWICPSFDGLLDLAQRDGVDIRPTLLRVLTDSYITHDRHTPGEERQYTELAMRLIDESDVATRAAVARRLAPYPEAPKVIILQLARDLLDVARPIWCHSELLTAEDRDLIIRERGDAYARLGEESEREAEPDAPPACADAPVAPTVLSPIATMPIAAPPVATPPAVTQTAPTPPVTALRAAAATPVVVDLAFEQSAKMATLAAPTAEGPALLSVEPDENAIELCEIFFAADEFERRMILLCLDHAPIEPAELVAPLRRIDVWRVETAALRHETEAVVRELQRTLGISPGQARRIVSDGLGEPLLVAAKAMEMPGDVLRRMLLFLNFRIGQSVDRIYELADLYADVSVDAARRLLAVWRAAEGSAWRPARHLSQPWQHGAENARRARSDVGRPQSEAGPRRDIIRMR
jgi:hypothetical protein